MIYEGELLNLECPEGLIKQRVFSDLNLLFLFNLSANQPTVIQFSYCCLIWNISNTLLIF